MSCGRLDRSPPKSESQSQHKGCPRRSRGNNWNWNYRTTTASHWAALEKVVTFLLPKDIRRMASYLMLSSNWNFLQKIEAEILDVRCLLRPLAKHRSGNFNLTIAVWSVVEAVNGVGCRWQQNESPCQFNQSES